MAVTFRLFVYGTLLPGEEDHPTLEGSKFVGPAQTSAGYTLVELNTFAGMIESRDCSVIGEVYEVDYDVLAACDKLRDHPHLYHRIEIDLADGTRAHTYVMHANQVRGKRRIKEGDWRGRFKGERPTAGAFVNWSKARYRN